MCWAVLLPKVFFIILRLVFLEYSQQFIFEACLFVMLFLGGDVLSWESKVKKIKGMADFCTGAFKTLSGIS